MTDDKESSSIPNKLEGLGDKSLELFGTAIIGIKPTEKTNISFFPDRKNGVYLSYDGTNNDKPSQGHIEAQAVAGIGSLQLNRIVFNKTQKVETGKFGWKTTTQEVGLLSGSSSISTSLLGNDYPSAPQLGHDPSVSTGTSGGIGYSLQKYILGENHESLNINAQIASKPHSPVIAPDTANAPRSSISIMSRDSFASGDKYAIGSTVFVQNRKPGIEVAGSRQFTMDGTSLNLSAEAIKSAAATLRTANVEVSHPVTTFDRDIIPYASVRVTQAHGSSLPDGVNAGTIKSLNIGVAQEIYVIRGFLQSHAESGQKPSVQFGIVVGDMSATTSLRKR